MVHYARVTRAVGSRRAWWIFGGFFALVCLVNGAWLWGGPYRDGWLYHGYYRHLADYVAKYHDTYYATRLSTIVPGHVLWTLLPAEWANVALRAALWLGSVGSFYALSRRLFGHPVGLASALALGANPILLGAAGWNYVDGFGIGYALAAQAAVAAAADRPDRRALLILAGASATALVTANVFYVVLLPLLPASWILVRQDTPVREAVRALGWFALGAALLAVAFGVLNAAMGGPFHYLEASLAFARGAQAKANPFRTEVGRWIRGAVWLIPLLAVAAGSLGVLARSVWRRGSVGRRERLAQVVYLVFVAAFVVLQGWKDMGVLQLTYYASLLLPAAFLAFAGQLATVTVGAAGRPSFVPAVAALASLVPLALARFGVRFFLSPQIAVASVVLVGIALAIRGRIAPFLLVAAMVVASTPRALIPSPREPRGLFAQMEAACREIDRTDPSGRMRLWYDLNGPHGGVFDAIACSFQLCPRIVSASFPRFNFPGYLCDGVALAGGQRIAVLSVEPGAFDAARLALAEFGFGARLVDRRPIPGVVAGFEIVVLDVVDTKGGT